jgi:DNA polymerase III subunit gamma/tau
MGTGMTGSTEGARQFNSRRGVSETVPHQALYRRWRAQTFGEIVGQEAAVTALRNAVRTGRVAQALLFVGPRGTGKTSMARIVAKALNCGHVQDGEPDDSCPACVAIRDGTSLDVAELDAASNNRVDDIRELLPRISTAPSDLRRKVFIIDEVQRIKEGWDVLLKTLEEPPDHVSFIFCTTDAGQIRPAVLSRVQRFDFRRLTVDQIAGKLRRILADANREADDDAVELVARLAAGGMRDAESMLDQLLSGGSDRLTADGVRALLGLADGESIDRFIGALATGDVLPGMRILDDLEDRGRDLRAFLDQLLEALRSRLVARLEGASGSSNAEPAIDPAHLAVIGRRLASIDPARIGPGGLRFQLELVLLETAGGAPSRPVEQAGPHAAQRPRPTAKDGPAVESRPASEPAAATNGTADVAQGSLTRASKAESDTADGRDVGSPTGDLATATEVASPLPDPTVDELYTHWAAIVADLSQHPAVKPLILACRPMGLEEKFVTLGFPEHQGFLREALERRRSTVEDGIARHLGRAVNVRFVATNVELLPPLPDDAESGRLLAEARRIFADDLVDVGEVG